MFSPRCTGVSGFMYRKQVFDLCGAGCCDMKRELQCLAALFAVILQCVCSHVPVHE